MEIKGITPPVDCQLLVNTPPTDQRTDRSITYNPRKCHQRTAITSPTHGEYAVYMSPNYHHASPDPYQSTTARGYNRKDVSNLDQLGEHLTYQNNSKLAPNLRQSMVRIRYNFKIWAHHVPQQFKTRFMSVPANGQNSKSF